MKLELASGLRVLLEQKKLKIPNNKKLIMQLNGLHYQVSKTGNMVFESPEKDKDNVQYFSLHKRFQILGGYIHHSMPMTGHDLPRP